MGFPPNLGPIKRFLLDFSFRKTFCLAGLFEWCPPAGSHGTQFGFRTSRRLVAHQSMTPPKPLHDGAWSPIELSLHASWVTLPCSPGRWRVPPPDPPCAVPPTAH